MSKIGSGEFYLTKLEAFCKRWSAKRVQDHNNKVFVHPHTAIRQGSVRNWIKKMVFPTYFKYYRVPTERSALAHYIMYCRHKAFMVDDNRHTTNEIYQRALDLVPLKLLQEREQRVALGNWLHVSKMELDPEKQNFDPFIPWCAPYIEEMRFMMQEEEELLIYHQYHRKVYKGGWTGFGEKRRYSKALACFW